MQRNRGGGWIGWVIFFVLVFGSRLLPPVANWLTQVTGLPISSAALMAGIVILGVVINIVGSAMRGVNRGRRSNETTLPTGLPPAAPPPLSAPPGPVAPPTAMPPSGPPRLVRPPEQQLPGAPRFEPIIDPRVLTFGIFGLIIFGGIFMLVLYFGGGLP